LIAKPLGEVEVVSDLFISVLLTASLSHMGQLIEVGLGTENHYLLEQNPAIRKSFLTLTENS